MTEFKIKSTEYTKAVMCTWTGNEIDLVKMLIEAMNTDDYIRTVLYRAVMTQSLASRSDLNELMDIAEKAHRIKLNII